MNLKYFSKDSRLLAILIDPEKHSEKELLNTIEKVERSNIDLIFVGSSLSSSNYDAAIMLIKKHSQKPVLLFPGNNMQLSSKADALLNLSLISGRNPELLIGEHVRSALLIKNLNIDIIPTGYILVEGGIKTSVEYISNTQAIPRRKSDIVLATALAGEQLGLKCVYLEAGSGAKESIPEQTIQLLKEHLNIPIICGGGIKTKKEIDQKWNAGANIVVVGTAFENQADLIDQF